MLFFRWAFDTPPLTDQKNGQKRVLNSLLADFGLPKSKAIHNIIKFL